ncbi:MAG TPA: LacI family DNA-binding transcriptional regulator [Coriobacteriia bacterium]|nr:LacI family DNA-binding transcriptional regulator [Coriobacteriia bacterium]
MTATLTDIATQLGVSTSSVSRALAGKSGVSDDLRRRVLEAAGEVGYGRAPVTSLAGSASPIGVIVPELDNPVFAAFAQQMATMLAQHGHAPMLCPQSAPGVSEDEWIEILRARGMAGLIVVSGMHADTHASMDRYRRLRRDQLPLVLVNGHVPGLDATSLSVDDAAAMSYAVDHLAALGHRRLGLALGPERYVPVIRKVDGFTRALHERPELMGTAPLIEHSMFTIEGGYGATSQLLDAGATGVICASDVMALGAIRAARSRGLSVPRDVSIIGFDGSAFDAYTDPPLTTLRQPVPAMAKAAVRALLEELHNGTHPRNEFLFNPELVVRASTAAAPRS